MSPSPLFPHVYPLCWCVSAIVKLVCFLFFEKRVSVDIFISSKKIAYLNIYDSIFHAAKICYISLSTKSFAIYLNEYVFSVCLSVSSCLEPPAQLPNPLRKQRPVCNCVFAHLRPTIRLH